MSNLITEVNDNLSGRGPSVRRIEESNIGKPVSETEVTENQDGDATEDNLTNKKYPSCEDPA